jgi:hypothetical protein
VGDVAVCASSADWIVVIKTKIKNFLSIKRVEYLRRLFAGGGIRFELWPYRAEQCSPGQQQHLALAPRSARCDVAVAVPIVARAIIIIKRYFMKVPPVEFRFHLAHRMSEPTLTDD